MEKLQFLIDELSHGRRFHISILDISGLLNTPATKIKFKNIVHIKNFCNKAKSTHSGYHVCQHCKMLSTTKAIQGKEAFGGHCMYGLYEVVNPVVVGDSVAAIVHVGNAVIDEHTSVQRIHSVCRHTGVNPEKLCDELKECERIDNPKELFRIANLVSDYMLWYYNTAPKQKKNQKMNWLVSMMKNQADEMYRTEINLSDLARTYGKNEKYMGRLFKHEFGISFAEYKCARRLELAESLLLKSDEKIIDIALECGFNNISYFNRTFLKKYGYSPSTYRAKKRKQNAH